jgi:hypothetical protein
VTRPERERNTHRRMNAAHRGREIIQSTTATASATTKWEKYTQLARTSYQWTCSGS